jgi:hypothetical protein
VAPAGGMLPVVGATCLLWDWFFLRRMKKNAARPMSARPTRGPTTAPAIQALLSPPPSLGTGVGDGLEELVGPPVTKDGGGNAKPEDCGTIVSS